jgi:N-methylhydantoinase B
MDFAGTSPQARGPINSSWSQSLSGAVYALLCHTNPDVPVNEGFYRALTVNFPQGTLVNPVRPAACNLRMAVVHAMVDAVNLAFAEAFPERAVAAPSVVATVTASGKDLDGVTPWSFLDAGFGVGGARYGLDGVDAVPHIIYGMSAYDRGVESYEAEHPVRYRCFKLLKDSGGAGQWRGGAGLYKEIEFLTDASVTVRASDRYRRPPQGAGGGRPGGGGAWVLNPGRVDEETLPTKKTNHFVRAGQTLAVVMAGGGGFGDPRDRDPAAILKDVAAGLVSAEAAVRDYGLDPALLPSALSSGEF